MATPQDLEHCGRIIEAVSLDTAEYDRLALDIAAEVYLRQGDECFEWLLRKAFEASTVRDAERYWFVLSSIGRYSDGFSETFVGTAYQIAADSGLPMLARSSCAIGALRWEVLYRPEAVYRTMSNLCDLVLSQDQSLRKDKVVLCDALAQRQQLQSSAQACSEFTRGNIQVPEELLWAVTSGRTPESSRLVEFGFDSSRIDALRKVVITSWGNGTRGRAPFAPSGCLSITTTYNVRSPTRIAFDILAVEWEEIDKGVYRAANIRLPHNVTVHTSGSSEGAGWWAR